MDTIVSKIEGQRPTAEDIKAVQEHSKNDPELQLRRKHLDALLGKKATSKKPHRSCQSVMQSIVARSRQMVQDLDRILDAAVSVGDKNAAEKLALAKDAMELAAREIKRARHLEIETQHVNFK